MKVKLFRQYSATITWNYGDNYADVPFSVGVTDWEEIDDNDFYNLRNAVTKHNQTQKEYQLILVKDHDVLPLKMLKDYKEYLDAENKKREKQEAERKLAAEKKRTEKLQKKLQKQKESKEQLLERLSKELGKKVI